jgi:hypothetical protein
MSWLRRRAIPTPPINTQEIPAMTDTASPPADVAPEVADAEARLAKIDPTLVSPELRAVTLRAAQTAAFAREAQEHVAECREAVQAATAARDMHDARIAALDLAAAERLAGMLPAIPDDRAAADACLALGAARLNEAAGVIPEAPILSATAEMAAYQSLPPQFLPDVEPPTATREDRQLQAAIDAWALRQRSIRDGIASWRRSVELHLNDPLENLGYVPSLVQIAADVTRDGATLAAQVNAANLQRRERDDEWQQVSPRDSTVASWTTDQIKALQAHRARMVAALAR